MPYPNPRSTGSVHPVGPPPPPPPPPAPPSPNFNISGGGVFSQPGGGTHVFNFAVVIVSGVGPYTYSWTDGSGLDAPTNQSNVSKTHTIANGGHATGVTFVGVHDAGASPPSSATGAVSWTHNG